MRKIACLSDDDRRELFRNTADKMGLNDAIVEKDFWVCFTLDYLFHRCPLKISITFKGGTSLSKALNHIQLYTTQKYSSKKILKFLPFHQSVPFGKRQQFFITKPTDRNFWICHNDIPDITMIS